MQRREVVTCFLRRGANVLLLRRSGRVRTYQGRWAAVSGAVEGGTAVEQAYVEIEEETGLTRLDVTLVAEGAALEVEAPELDTRWIVRPFLFDVAGDAQVRLNWENDEARWVDPATIDDLDTVPQLRETWARVGARQAAPLRGPRLSTARAAAVAAFAADREHGATELAREAVRILREVAEGGAPDDELRALARQLAAAKPTMAAVKNAVRRVLAARTAAAAHDAAAAVRACDEAMDWLTQAAAAVVAAGTEAVPPHATILTCSHSSTVAAVCARAHDLGNSPTVLVLESRAWEWAYGEKLAAVLARAGIRCEVLADSAASDAARRATLAMVGADRVLPDGALVNGTPTLALARACDGVAPFLVACETFKLDDATEVEPGFDLVSPRLISRYITERGVAPPEGVWALRN